MSLIKIINSIWAKPLAIVLSLLILCEVCAPLRLMALTSGPDQPEYGKFQPIGANDMVDLFSGDLKYNIPLFDVGGYPINLVYEGGVGMEQEASWVGLGWNINVGAINRLMKGLPDDFNGQDKIVQETRRKNHTVIKLSPKAPRQEKNGDKKSNEGTATFLKLKSQIKADVSFVFDNYKGFGIEYDLGISDTSARLLGLSIPQFNFSYSSLNGTSAGLGFEHDNSKKQKLFKRLLKDLMVPTSVGFNSNEGLSDLGFSTGKSWPQKTKEHLPRSVTSKWSLFRPQPIPDVNPSYINRTQNFSFTLGKTKVLPTRKSFIINVNRSVSKIREDQQVRYLSAYGFFYMGKSNVDPDAVEDVDEEAKNFDRKSVMLSTSSYTADVFAVSGHGVGGSFTPTLNSLGLAKNIEYESKGLDKVGGISANLEFDKGATGKKLGIEIGASINSEKSGTWGILKDKADGDRDYDYRYNRLGRYLGHNFKTTENNPYEPWYYKNQGEFLDVRSNLYSSIDGAALVSPKLYLTPTLNFGVKAEIGGQNITGAVENDRRVRRTVMTSLTASQAAEFAVQKDIRSFAVLESSGVQILANAVTIPQNVISRTSDYRSPHHLSEIKVLNEGGSTYVYGIPVYNKVTKEVNFNVENNSSYDHEKNMVTYSSGDNSASNSKGVDNYYSSKVTAPYATSFLLTELLSPDYVDNDGVPGPSKDDLGGYVKFNYHKKADLFKWRSPYGTSQAFLNKGVRTDNFDDKGHYSYGEKELWYLQSIETKTHVALFFVSAREDARGVLDETGAYGTGNDAIQYKLDRIELYAKEDFDVNGTLAKPLKIVHFSYSYDLCPNVSNFNPSAGTGGTHPLNAFNSSKYNYNAFSKKGKLTLHKVLFTYGDLQYASTAPYIFEYSDQNPDYDPKAMDMWGNYKPSDYHRVGADLDKCLNNSDYPYLPQDDRTTADEWAEVYMISKIHLPSGGTISLEYESDDYAYVQDKQAMEMLKIEAFDDWTRWELLRLSLPAPGNIGSRLHQKLTGDCKDLIVVKKPDGYTGPEEIMKDDPVMYFNCFVDLNGKGRMEPIQGFFEVEEVDEVPAYSGFSSDHLYLKIKPIPSNKLAPIKVHPISKFAWQYTSANAQQLLFASSDLRKSADLTGMDAVKKYAGIILNFIPQTVKMLEGEARYMIQIGAGVKLDLSRSFVRVYNQNKKKVGGGYRVKKVHITDNWDKFTTSVSGGVSTIKEQKATYTQEYAYTSEENSENISSGVATYEPSTSMENPHRVPISLLSNSAIKNALNGNNATIFQTSGGFFKPISLSYELGPIAETYYPGPSVGYSKVTVKSSVPAGVTAHATGRTVNEFYTARDFPVKSYADRIDVKKLNFLPISSQLATSMFKVLKSKLQLGLDVSYKKELFAASQGFLIETNDMHGKPKAVWNYDEFGDKPMTGVVYKYKTNVAGDPSSGLSSDVTVVHPNGTVEANVPMGIDVDFVINPSWHRTMGHDLGLDFNMNIVKVPLPVVIPPIITFSPKYHLTNRETRKITFTKVVRRSGILESVEAIDHGASLNTVNLAYDAITGELLLSKVQNEFGDYKYSFNKPAHWVYDGMAGAWKNINLVVKLTTNSNGIATDASGLLQPGDELIPLNTADYTIGKVWILDRETNKVSLIDKDGAPKSSLTDKLFVLVRSAHRNMPATGIESITGMSDFITYSGGVPQHIRGPYTNVLSASAASFYDTTRLYYKERKCFLVQCGPPEEEDSFPPSLIPTSNNYAPISVSWNGDCTSPGGTCKCLEGCDTYLEPGDEVNPFYKGLLGIWRPYRSYVYYGRDNADFARNRDQDNADPNTTNIRTNGYIEDFLAFWDYKTTPQKWEEPNFGVYTPWTWNQTLTMADNRGNELMSKDALDIHSSAFFGYNKMLATHVAGNSEYREMLFDGFEDYDPLSELAIFCNNSTPYLDANSAWISSFCKAPRHWPLYKALYAFGPSADPLMSISAAESHTGWQSLKLMPGQREVALTPELNTIGITGPGSGNPYWYFTLNKSNFIEGYTPKANKDYVVSYWVKESNGADFELELIDPSTSSAYTTTTLSKTRTIDGWTRYELKFKVTTGNEKIIFRFINTNSPGYSNQPVYMDDLRIFPYKSNMKSFVYDRLNLRLMATLDENNYATFYEYDAEGNLVRKKVETERGVMTVSESTSSLKK